jgi:hypothetical protein
MLQIARRLRFGGTGFIHHSNLGAYKRRLLAKRVLVKLCRGSGWLGNRLIHDCMRAPDMTAISDGALLSGSRPDLDSARTRSYTVGVLTQSDRLFYHLQEREGPYFDQSRQVFVNHHFMQEAASTKRLAAIYGPSPTDE